jgi:FMN reductase
MTVLAISGSPSRQSRSNGLLGQATLLLNRRGLKTEYARLRDIPAEDLIEARFQSPAAKILRAKFEFAQAVIVATPIYKASFSGGLKTLLDLLPQDALAGKIVLPIATGGSAAHLLALEYGLKPVLSALGARTILGGLYASDAQVTIAADGSLEISAEIATRLEEAIDDLALALAMRQSPVALAALAPAVISAELDDGEVVEDGEDGEGVRGRVRSAPVSPPVIGHVDAALDR